MTQAAFPSTVTDGDGAVGVSGERGALWDVFVTCPRRAFGSWWSSGACAAAAADRKESCGRVHELHCGFRSVDTNHFAGLVLVALWRVLELGKALRSGFTRFALLARVPLWAFGTGDLARV
jgi:hypothetical protein